MIGTMGNPNFLGAYLAISLPLFYRKWWFLGAALIVYAILMSKCEMAMLAAVASTWWFVFKEWHTGDRHLCFKVAFFPRVSLPRFNDRFIKLFALGVVPILATAYLLWEHGFFSGNLKELLIQRGGTRLVNWTIVANVLLQGPLNMIFGCGPASDISMQPIHNGYVWLLGHFGIIGFVLFAMFLIKLPKTHTLFTCSFIAICVDACGSIVMRIPALAYPSIIIFALMSRQKSIERSL
jgi:hypothetical protein